MIAVKKILIIEFIARILGELGKLESVIVCPLTEFVNVAKLDDVTVICPLTIKIEGTSIFISS